MVPAHGYDLELIPSVPLPRKPTPDLLRVPGRVTAAVRAAGDVLEQAKADLVVGFGGYVALPAYLAARRRRLPFVVHEANVRPGLGQPDRRPAHPVRRGGRRGDPAAARAGDRASRCARRSATLDRAARRAEARAHFGLDPDRPTLLVTGGSQGARSLNHAAAGAAAALRAAGVQVLHVAGPKNVVSVDDAGRRPRATSSCPTSTRWSSATPPRTWCCAAPACNTVAELTAVGLPAAYVPLPIGNGEQRLNALPVVAGRGRPARRRRRPDTGRGSRRR